MTSQIFISYSKKDRVFAWKLADDLINSGYTVWIDRSLTVGEDWEKTIEKNLTESDEIIVVLSSNAVASNWVQHEGSIAYGLKKRMYPVLIEEIPGENLPIWMSKFQYHSFVGIAYEKSFENLVAALKPRNPLQDLITQKRVEYEKHKFLLDKKELELISDELHDANFEVDDPDKRFLFYSALALDLEQDWLSIVGENKAISWSRETLQDEECPQSVRTGAAAFLGSLGDRTAYDELSQIVRKLDPDTLKDDALDILASFLLRSPLDFKFPDRFQRKLFFRLACLRLRDGVAQRQRMKRVAMIASLANVLVLFFAYFRFGDIVRQSSLLLVIIAFVVFLILGILFAYLFAEVLTSLELIIWRQPQILRFFLLVVLGVLAGAPLFLIVNASKIVWFAGGLVGIVLGLWNVWPFSRKSWFRWLLLILAAFISILVALSNIALSPLEAITVAINTTSFIMAYLFFHAGFKT